MNYLAIDTGAKYLSVVARKGETEQIVRLEDCAMRHSVVLMDEIGKTLSEAGASVSDCDFFAAVVGPGSFTGIRIGIATVKGLCFATGKPALSVTSFDTLAYAEKSEKLLALVDAGHGFFYACPYDKGAAGTPAYLSADAVQELVGAGYAPVSAEPLSLPTRLVDPAKGLSEAVKRKCGELCPAGDLLALYLRKSSAEEKR